MKNFWLQNKKIKLVDIINAILAKRKLIKIKDILKDILIICEINKEVAEAVRKTILLDKPMYINDKIVTRSEIKEIIKAINK